MPPPAMRLTVLAALLLSGCSQAWLSPGPSLPGTSWVVPGTEATLTFGEGMQLSGFTGCDRFTARYTQGPRRNALTVTEAVATERACAPEAMRTERRVLEALGRVAEAYGRDELTLADASGAVLLTLRRAE